MPITTFDLANKFGGLVSNKVIEFDLAAPGSSALDLSHGLGVDKPLVLQDSPILSVVTPMGAPAAVGTVSSEAPWEHAVPDGSDVHITMPDNADGAYNAMVTALAIHSAKGYGVIPSPNNVAGDPGKPRRWAATQDIGSVIIDCSGDLAHPALLDATGDTVFVNGVDYDLCDVHGHKVMPDFVTIVPRSLVAGPPDSTPAFFWNLQNSSADQVMISGCARNGGTPASGWVILWYRHSAHFPSHWTVSDEIVEEAGGAPFDVDVYPNPEYFLNAQQAAVCNPPPDGTWTHDGWPIVMITPLNADGCCGLYIDDLKVAPVPPGLNYGVNVKSVNAAGQGAAFKVMFWNPHSMIS